MCGVAAGSTTRQTLRTVKWGSAKRCLQMATTLPPCSMSMLVWTSGASPTGCSARGACLAPTPPSAVMYQVCLLTVPISLCFHSTPPRQTCKFSRRPCAPLLCFQVVPVCPTPPPCSLPHPWRLSRGQEGNALSCCHMHLCGAGVTAHIHGPADLFASNQQRHVCFMRMPHTCCI